jgi:hypothetical protein
MYKTLHRQVNVEQHEPHYKPKVNLAATKGLVVPVPNVDQNLPGVALFSTTPFEIRVITKLSNSEQSYKGKVKTHNYINRQNQSTTGKL